MKKTYFITIIISFLMIFGIVNADIEVKINEVPEDAGEIIETINKTEQIELWHYSGGYWESKAMKVKIYDDELGDDPEYLAEILVREVTFEISLPQKVKKAIDEGMEVTVGVEADESNFDLDRKHKAEIKNNKLYFKAFPKYNFLKKPGDIKLLSYKDFPSLVNLSKSIPFVNPSYGTNTYSMFGKAGTKAASLAAGYTANYIDIDNLTKVSSDGRIHPSQIKDTNGNLISGFKVRSLSTETKDYESSDVSIGKGTFNNAGAVGLIFTYPLKITFYEDFGEPKKGDEVEFTIYHYEEDTEREVFERDIITDPKETKAYPKSGIGLDGKEWVCITGNKIARITVVDNGEHIFYYTNETKRKKSGNGERSGSSGKTESITVKDLKVMADCNMPGRRNIKKNDKEYFPEGQPLFKGDIFKPYGKVTNQNIFDVLIEYKLTLKDKIDGNNRITKNFRVIDNIDDGEIVIKKNNYVKLDPFVRTIGKNEPYGNVYTLTVEARQRPIIAAPPIEPREPKEPREPREPNMPKEPADINFERATDKQIEAWEKRWDRYWERVDQLWEKYDRDWDEYIIKYYEWLDEYYEWEIEHYEWEIEYAEYEEAYGEVINEKNKNPEDGIANYYIVDGNKIWLSGNENYTWQGWKRDEDLNFVMPNIAKEIDDLIKEKGGLRPGVIVE